MFRGTPCNIDCLRNLQTYFGMEWDLEEQNLAILKINSYRIRSARENQWIYDCIVFSYKLHTNIKKFWFFNCENFEVLTEDDIYMGL